MHINLIALINKCLYNPDRHEWRHHLSIRSHISALIYFLTVLGGFRGISQGYLWSFLLRSRLCSCAESWGATGLQSTGSCFTWTRLNWLAEAGCPFPEDHARDAEDRGDNKVIVGQCYYPVTRSNLTPVLPEKNTPSDNYCEIMSGRQAF